MPQLPSWQSRGYRHVLPADLSRSEVLTEVTRSEGILYQPRLICMHLCGQAHAMAAEEGPVTEFRSSGLVPLPAEPSCSLVFWRLLSQNEWKVKENESTDPFLQGCCRTRASCQLLFLWSSVPIPIYKAHPLRSQTSRMDVEVNQTVSQCQPIILHIWKTLVSAQNKTPPPARGRQKQADLWIWGQPVQTNKQPVLQPCTNCSTFKIS